MRPGFDPTRRNRNIGTANQGKGSNNKLTIPSICQAERVWWEQLGEHRVVEQQVCGRQVLFLIEHPRQGFAHACSAADICQMLNFVPAEDWEGLTHFLLRQSTHKQRTLAPVWGRLAFYAELGRPAKRTIVSGPALILEAVAPHEAWHWSTSLSPDDALELDRLVADGHAVIANGRRFELRSTAESVRATQLYRTLLHEIGHWVDWLRFGDKSGDERYWSRPQKEREDFAHRYAERVRKQLLKAALIPFPRLEDPA